MAAIDYVSVVQQLYVSYFGRPADYFGLKNFTEQLDALGAPKTFVELNSAIQADKTSALATLVNSFNGSTESSNLYGTDTSEVGTSKFVESIYLHLFNRAPDVEGWNYWVGEILAGRVTRASAAAAITEGALSNTTTQGLADKAAIQNKVTVATSFTNGLDTVAEINGFSGDAAAATARGLLAVVDSTTDTVAYQSTVDATIAAVVTASIPATNATLTKGVDTIVGGNGNDVITAVLNGNGDDATTLTALDKIDGGAGEDTLKINQLVATTFPSVTVTNVENLEFRSAVAATVDTTTGFTGLNKVTITQATDADVTAGSTTAIVVGGATGDIVLEGGSTQTVTTSGGTVDSTKAKGAISVTHTAQDDNNITLAAGTTVTVTASGVTTGEIDIGTGTKPTGAVTITSTGAAAGGAAAVALGDISVAGGSTVTVTQKATSDASAAAEDASATTHAITQSDVSIAGTGTTAVTVIQDAAAAGKDAVEAEAGKSAVDVVTFLAMLEGESTTIGGLTFTAAKDLTAAQVAAAFANLTTGAHQGTAPASNGVYSGSYTAVFSSGAVVKVGTAQTVTFTSNAKDDGVAAISVADTIAASDVAAADHTAGVDSVTGVTGELAIVGGTVAITSTDNKIATVTLEGWGDSSTVASNGLTALNLAHSKEDLTVTTTATTLALGLNDVTGDAAIGLSSSYTTLNITTGASKSDVVLADVDGVTALTVAGASVVDLNASDFSALKTLVVTGSAGVKVDASASTVTSVDTSGTTGASSITIDATKATFTGGAGADTVTTSAAAPTKAINLGAGDDTLILASGTTSSTGALNGGAGTDTLAMDAADAADASAAAGFDAKIAGFEVLKLGVAATDEVNLANLDNIDHIISAGNTTSLTLTNVAGNATVELTGAAVLTDVQLADADGDADVLNVALKSTTDAGTAFGTINAADIETIKLAAVDLNGDSDATTIAAQTVTLKGDALTSVVVTGSADLTLNLNANVTALTSVDATALTGSLTYATNAASAAAATVKGGAGADDLTANHNSDVLNGGAGADTLTVNADLVKLTGGAGNDTFNVAHATTDSAAFATITDLTAGDSIVFSGATSFASSKVVLDADVATFLNYANAVINQTDGGDVAWFQVGGNTYVIEHNSADAATSFVNGTDVIVKITGLVDLSKSSLNADDFTLIVR